MIAPDRSSSRYSGGWPDPLIGINRQVPRPRGSGSAVQNGPITALK